MAEGDDQECRGLWSGKGLQGEPAAVDEDVEGKVAEFQERYETKISIFFCTSAFTLLHVRYANTNDL